MPINWIDSGVLNALALAAKRSGRSRQHLNLHNSPADPAQRLLNHICSDSYIRPHRHMRAGGDETLVAIRGLFGLLVFDEHGAVVEHRRFGSEHFRQGATAAAVVVGPEVWHSVVTLSGEAVLLECKGGPFDAHQAKELAPWAPDEGSSLSCEYLLTLRGHFA